jgi:hypothetical protein
MNTTHVKIMAQSISDFGVNANAGKIRLVMRDKEEVTELVKCVLSINKTTGIQLINFIQKDLHEIK